MTRAIFAQSKTHQPGQRPLRSRFEICMDISTGELAFPITRVDPLFEELPLTIIETSSPSEWLGQVVRKLAHAAKTNEMNARPIHVPMPFSILADPNGPARAQQAVRDEDCCPQEFILEFQDASFSVMEVTGLDRMEDYRRIGFRIGLDARTSSAAPFGARLRSAVERMRVSSEELLFDETIQMRAEIVSSIGGDVIIDRAPWQKAELLRSYGATHALRMMADA